MRIPVNSEERFKIQGDIPYYGANGVQGYINNYIFNEDLILLAEDGGNFEAYQERPIAYRISGKSWVNNHAHILKAKPEYIQDFIFYSIVHKNIISYIHGGTRSKLNQSELKEIEINFFEKTHQQKIAKILNTIDSVIEKTEDVISKYQVIKKGMMHDLFTCGIDIKTGQLRPGFEDAPALYEESDLGLIPKDWEVEKLDQITNYVDYRGKTPTKSDRGTFLITAKNVKNGYIDYNISKEYIPTKNFESVMSRGKASIGDVLITTEAPLGNVAQINKENIALAQRVIKYKGKDSSLNNTFLKYTFLSDYFQAKIYQESTGSTVLGIKGSKLHIVKIKLPQPEEQIKISKKLIQVDRLIKKEQKILAKHQNIKKGLMQDLLTGKVEVTV
jgi:type I restriction enzyme S subunit